MEGPVRIRQGVESGKTLQAKGTEYAKIRRSDTMERIESDERNMQTRGKKKRPAPWVTPGSDPRDGYTRLWLPCSLLLEPQKDLMRGSKNVRVSFERPFWLPIPHHPRVPSLVWMLSLAA